MSSFRLPDAVPVIPADERLEGAALAPVTVGAHQTVRTRPVPDNIQHFNISYHTNITLMECGKLFEMS